MPNSKLSRTPLAAKAGKAGGLGVEEAVAAAQRNLDGMRDRILAEIDRELAAIRSRLPALQQEDAEASHAVAASADILTGLCATPDLVPIGDAARSVCKLAEELEPPLPVEAVRLLYDTMIFLREQSDEGRLAAWKTLQGGVQAAIVAATHKRLRKTIPFHRSAPV